MSDTLVKSCSLSIPLGSSNEEIWKELLLQSRDDFKTFIHTLFIDEMNTPLESTYDFQPHHLYLIEALTTPKDNRHLVLVLPPRAGKSLLVRLFMLWNLGRRKGFTGWFICATSELADSWWADIESTLPGATNAITSQKGTIFQNIFPRFKNRSKTSIKYIKKTREIVVYTDGGETGKLMFHGLKGAIPGRGADLIVLDDAYKNLDDVREISRRNKLWAHFTSGILTRQSNSDARIIIPQTRWHSDDIAGRLTDPNNKFYNPSTGKEWRLISLPALAEKDDILGRKEGESIWPKKFTEEHMNSFRRLNPDTFQTLMQGKPFSTRDHNFGLLDVDVLKTYKKLPTGTTTFCTMDLATTTKDTSDYSAFLILEVLPDGRVFISPKSKIVKVHTDEIKNILIKYSEDLDIATFFVEDDNIWKACSHFITPHIEEEFHLFSSRKNKKEKSKIINTYLSSGSLYVPEFSEEVQEWLPLFLKHLTEFSDIGLASRRVHDDAVDALSVALNNLDMYIPNTYTDPRLESKSLDYSDVEVEVEEVKKLPLPTEVKDNVFGELFLSKFSGCYRR